MIVLSLNDAQYSRTNKQKHKKIFLGLLNEDGKREEERKNL
jgi:hypothetical protein